MVLVIISIANIQLVVDSWSSFKNVQKILYFFLSQINFSLW